GYANALLCACRGVSFNAYPDNDCWKDFESIFITTDSRADFCHEGKHKNEKLEKNCSKKPFARSEEHTSELQSRFDLVCRLLLEKKKKIKKTKHKNN